jgi:hypothetical protein
VAAVAGVEAVFALFELPLKTAVFVLAQDAAKIVMAEMSSASLRCFIETVSPKDCVSVGITGRV